MAKDLAHSRRIEFNLDILPKQQVGDSAVKNPPANSEDAGDTGF